MCVSGLGPSQRSVTMSVGGNGWLSRETFSRPRGELHAQKKKKSLHNVKEHTMNIPYIIQDVITEIFKFDNFMLHKLEDVCIHDRYTWL